MSLIDVRSPSEYAKGHIPGALNLPLFDDLERAEVGTAYKQIGQKEAVALGLEIAAEKKTDLLNVEPSSVIYCWRGGMRSAACSQFLNAAGIETRVYPGGYKAFRKWVYATLEEERNFKVIGGKTGVGKTEILRTYSEPVLDLEKLAHHRGSTFGAFETPQPTQEQFENLLADTLTRLGKGPIWVEDESRMIGKLKLPDPLWNQMKGSPLTILESPLEERIERLVGEYGQLPREKLIEATIRLEKRLGSQRMRVAIAAIQKGDYSAAVREILPYYDKAYAKSMERKSG